MICFLVKHILFTVQKYIIILDSKFLFHFICLFFDFVYLKYLFMRVSPKMALLILPLGRLAGQGQKQMCH